VGLLPRSRWEVKNWPLESFIALAGRLRERANVSLFLLGGAADREACAAIEKALGGDVTNLVGQTSLPELGGRLRGLDLLIANDSGPVHMAVAAGTPTLVVFGPTDPNRTGPYGDGHRVVTAPVDCRPCRSRSCRKTSTACLEQVKPEQVADVAVEMLDSAGIRTGTV